MKCFFWLHLHIKFVFPLKCLGLVTNDLCHFIILKQSTFVLCIVEGSQIMLNLVPHLLVQYFYHKRKVQQLSKEIKQLWTL